MSKKLERASQPREAMRHREDVKNSLEGGKASGHVRRKGGRTIRACRKLLGQLGAVSPGKGDTDEGERQNEWECQKYVQVTGGSLCINPTLYFQLIMTHMLPGYKNRYFPSRVAKTYKTSEYNQDF
jgi:hypothetical protein